MRIDCYLKVFTLITFILLFSCKKDKTNSPVNLSTNITASTPISGDFYFTKRGYSNEYLTEQIIYDVNLKFFNPALIPTSTLTPVLTDVGDVFVNGYKLKKYSFLPDYIFYAGFESYPDNVLELPFNIQNSGNQNSINFSGSFPCVEFSSLNNFDQLPFTYSLSAGFNYTLSGTNIPSSYHLYIGGYGQDTLNIDTMLSGNVISIPGQLFQSRLDTGDHIISISFMDHFNYYVYQNKVFQINYETRYVKNFVKFY